MPTPGLHLFSSLGSVGVGPCRLWRQLQPGGVNSVRFFSPHFPPCVASFHLFLWNIWREVSLRNEREKIGFNAKNTL